MKTNLKELGIDTNTGEYFDYNKLNVKIDTIISIATQSWNDAIISYDRESGEEFIPSVEH